MIRATFGRSLTASVSALILLCSSHSAFAGPAPRTHDGFFLRLSAGGGGSSTKVEYIDEFNFDEELTMSGVTGDVNIAIGAMVTQSLALHGTLYGWSITDPTAEFRSGPEGDVSGSFTVGEFGIGVTNYFMPSNMYVSASVGLASFTIDLDELGDYESDTGVGFDLTLGKEWWVSDNWGLGLAGSFGFHNIPDKDEDDWKGTSFSIRFSSTYN